MGGKGMQIWQMKAGLLALGLSGAPGAALALTGPELWQDWQEIAQSWGATFTAKTERQEGEVLVLEGLEAKLDYAPFGLNLSWAQDNLRLTNLPDGAVEIGSDSPAYLAGTLGGEAGLQVNLTFTSEESMVRAWDEEPVRRYERKAARDVVEGRFVIPAFAGPAPETLKLNAVSTGVSQEWRWRSGANPVISHVSRSESDVVRYSLVGVDDSQETEIGTNEVLGGEYALSLVPPQMSGPLRLQSFADLAALLDSGLSLTASVSMREQRVEGRSGFLGEKIMNSTISHNIRSEASLSARGLSIAQSENDLEESFSLPGLAAPLAWKVAGLRVNMALPVMGGEAQQATLDLHLRDFTLDESVWALFDAKGALPRDPMQLDLTLESTQAFDLLAWAEVAMTAPTPPEPAPRLDRVAVPNIFFSGAGVTARGQGSFSFTESDNGLVPEGAGALDAQGLEAFVGALEEGGSLPPDAIMALRAGIAMAFKKVPGSDDMTMKLEAAPGGPLMLNGLPLTEGN